MKVKLKNANAITALLLAHGEKIGIVAIGAVAALLVWKSLGREKLDKVPDDLNRAVTQAANHVRDVDWANIPAESKVEAKAAAEDASLVVLSPVRESDFPDGRQWNPPVTIPLNKRTDPVILPPLEPEVRGGAGLWLSGDPETLRQKRLEAMEKMEQEKLAADAAAEEAAREAEENRDRRGRGRGRDREEENNLFAGGMAGSMKTKDGAIIVPPTSGMQLQGLEDIRNRYWVTVLAKIPVAQQYRMYEDALLNTRGYDPTKDVPDYFGYQVERAEVTDQGQGDWQSLGDVTVEGIKGVMKTWPVTQTTELVSPQYLHPLLTFPLPPMILRPWGDEITHSDMPLQTPEMILAELEAEAAAAAEAAAGEAGADGEELTAFDRVAKLKQSIEERNDPTRQPMYGGLEMGGPEGLGGGMMSRGSYGLEGGMSGMAELGSGGEFVLPTFNWDRKTEFILFRYFDSRVEPGKQYKYRIRLVLGDVNANQPESLLDPKVNERKAKSKSRFFFTDWSEESPVATVPQPGLVFVKGVKNSPNPNVTESQAELLVKSLDSTYAAEVGVSGLFTRGSVLNLKRQAQVIWSSLFDPQANPESPPFEMFSGQTLVDFDGGEKLPAAGQLAPIRVLLMGASGRMTLHNDLENTQPVDEFNAIIAADKAAAAQRNDNDNRRGGRGRGPER